MADSAPLRAKIRDLYRRLGELLDALPPGHSTVAGIVYRLRTRCGKPHCICWEGELHSAWCLSYSEGRKRRLRTLPPEALEKLHAMAQRYRQLRTLRAQFTRTFGELLRVFDRLERSYRVSPKRALGRPRREGV
jgi:hypothetical protein